MEQWKPKLGERVRISCERDTTNPDIRTLRETRKVGIVWSVPYPNLPDFYVVAFNGDDEKSMFTFRGTEIVPESAQGDCEGIIPVMRWHMDGLPDLYVKESKNLGSALEGTFLGDLGEWKDGIGGKPLICTFEMMSRADFEALEPWEP